MIAIVMLSLRRESPSLRHHHPPPGGLLSNSLQRLAVCLVALVCGLLACLPAARVGVSVLCVMSSSPDSGLSIEEQLEQKWSLESLECMDVQALITMW